MVPPANPLVVDCGIVPLFDDLYRVEVCIPSDELVDELYHVRFYPPQHLHLPHCHRRDGNYNHVFSAVLRGLSVVVEVSWDRVGNGGMGCDLCDILVLCVPAI